ncbi:MAG: ATP-binding protein [Deltaproteobacteria bacterium]|nr:ATP-binding protein [Deltaproteobacteria bacterium]
MAEEIEHLVRQLEPIKGRKWAKGKLQEYNNGKFSPTLRKVVELEVKSLSNYYDLDNQITLHPVPSRPAVVGEYLIGFCHYGKHPMNAQFGLRDQNFIKHVGCFGATGSGKTTTAMRIIRQLCERRKPFLILDPKGTWQAIIRKDWARDVKILKLGSTYAPYTFDPFMPLPGMDIDTMIAEVVEAFCDTQYLGYGAKSLLLRAIYSARGKGRLTLRQVFEEFKGMHLTGQKEKLWYSSTLRALESASTGILGRVLNYRDNVLFERLMDSQVVIVMDALADHDQVAMFNGLMLNRIYWHRKLAGVKERFKHILVLEEFHIMSSAVFSKGESRIDFLTKMCREFSQGIMVLEQNPGNISQSVLGNLNTIISMNLGHQNDINAVGTGMVLDAQGKKYLGRLPTGWAICRVKDRFPESVLVKVDFEYVNKSDLSPGEIREHNEDFVSEASQEIAQPEPVSGGEFAVFSRRDKLGHLDRKVLRYLKINKCPNLRNCYIAHGLSYRRGNTIRKRLEGAGLIYSKVVSTETGKEIRLSLTDKGMDYLKNTEDYRRLGGKWHRSAVQRIASHYEAQGYRVRLEYRDIDVYAEKNGERVAIEAESLSGTKDVVHAVSNVRKALRLADRVESVVKDKASAKKLQDALRNSPLQPKDFGRVKIRLIGSYNSSH